jgi:hypothetical protein
MSKHGNFPLHSWKVGDYRHDNIIFLYMIYSEDRCFFLLIFGSFWNFASPPEKASPAVQVLQQKQGKTAEARVQGTEEDQMP